MTKTTTQIIKKKYALITTQNKSETTLISEIFTSLVTTFLETNILRDSTFNGTVPQNKSTKWQNLWYSLFLRGKLCIAPGILCANGPANSWSIHTSNPVLNNIEKAFFCP